MFNNKTSFQGKTYCKARTSRMLVLGEYSRTLGGIGEQVICRSVYLYILTVRHYALNTFSALPNLANRRILVNTLVKISFCDYLSISARTPENVDEYSVFAYSRLFSEN